MEKAVSHKAALAAAMLMIAAVMLFVAAPMASHTEGSGDTVTFQVPSGPVVLEVEIADTPEEHSLGLMNRESLDVGSGMLFIFDDDSPRSFWMKNTLIPLDMVFVNSSLDIVRIEGDAQPCTTSSCRTYASGMPAMYVVEANGGFCQEHGIVAGQKVVIDVGTSH